MRGERTGHIEIPDIQTGTRERIPVSSQVLFERFAQPVPFKDSDRVDPYTGVTSPRNELVSRIDPEAVVNEQGHVMCPYTGNTQDPDDWRTPVPVDYKVRPTNPHIRTYRLTIRQLPTYTPTSSQGR